MVWAAKFNGQRFTEISQSSPKPLDYPCHAIANGVAARGKNNLFKSLCVFAFKTGRELVGKKQRSFACRVIEHEVPNLQNWRNYFVGFDSSVKHQVWEGLQPTMPLMIPGASTETPALPGAVSEEE